MVRAEDCQRRRQAGDLSYGLRERGEMTGWDCEVHLTQAGMAS
jgi:hypothetical protein